MDEPIEPACGPGRKSYILLFVVVAIALLTLAVAIYTLVDRRGKATLTPAGANYNPGPSSTGADTPTQAPR